MPNNTQLRGQSFSVTASGTTSASANISMVTGTVYYITDITSSTDLAGGTAVLYAGATVGSGTSYWTVRVGSTDTYEENFQTPLKIASGGTISFLVNGTAYSSANISGYSI